MARLQHYDVVHGVRRLELVKDDARLPQITSPTGRAQSPGRECATVARALSRAASVHLTVQYTPMANTARVGAGVRPLLWQCADARAGGHEEALTIQRPQPSAPSNEISAT